MLKDYQRISKIGQGAYGQVYLFQKNKQKNNEIKTKTHLAQRYAVKSIPNKHIHLDIQAKLLPKLNHPNIISTKQIFYDDHGINFIMEYASNGDLDKYVSQKFNLEQQSIDNKTLTLWFLQMCLGLNYLHENHNIIHRDIKMKNILVMQNGLLKLTDFGISRQLQKGEEYAVTSLGTFQVLSPQIYGSDKYDKKTDVWGLGCIMFELCTGKKPFYSDTLKQLFDNITKKQYTINDLPSNYSFWIRQIIIKMLQKKPTKRPTIHNILQKPQMRQAFQQLKFIYPESYMSLFYPALALLTTKYCQKDEKLFQIFSLKTAKNDNTKYSNNRSVNNQNQAIKQCQQKQKTNKVQWNKFYDRSLKALIQRSKQQS